MKNFATIAALLGGVLTLGVGARADVAIEWVRVGDPGNAGELAGAGAGGYGPDRICGAVDHEYHIAKYEVTNGQYTEFLNAVAAVRDPHGLYKVEMAGPHGGIVRVGSGTTADPWIYAPKGGDPNWATRPVCFVSFYDALRFTNWMHNGQPTGAQNAGTTEDGAYDMSLGEKVVRKDGARVFLPNEDEWYKAAFYKGGGTKAGYWNFATQSDTLPVAELPPGRAEPPRSANCRPDRTGLAVGPPYYSTPVGAYTHAPSAYGTFDQTGNVNEWVEERPYRDQSYRSLLGGAWITWPGSLHAAMRHKQLPTFNCKVLGFRLASVLPEASRPGARSQRKGVTSSLSGKNGE
jgi:sulfatase modifying factor 1